MFNILVVEDEIEISSILKKYIEKEGYQCTVSDNGFDALKKFNDSNYHLLILDIMMPGIDGFEVLKRVRDISQVPVIFLTAKEAESDRLQGFDIGADDYVVKPFSPRELMKKMQVFLRRVYPQASSCIQSGPFELELDTMILTKNHEVIEITSAEFKLMKTFMTHQHHILTRDQIIDDAFGIDYDGNDRTIDSYIKRLRQKIEASPKDPIYLKTKYGQGYVFGGDES